MIRAKTTAIDLYEVPAYGVVEAAQYLRVPYQTLRYWLTGYGKIPPLVSLASEDPPLLSFMNLLECHMLSAMRSEYDLRIPKVRRALLHLKRKFPSRHPLLDHDFQTDRVDLFIENLGQLIDVSRGGQLGMEFLRVHLERVERDAKGLLRFFPFVMKRTADEPRHILIDPSVGFGKPVLAGTGIATRIIAARFNARESIRELAEEYCCREEQVEEAIRWEEAKPLAA